MKNVGRKMFGGRRKSGETTASRITTSECCRRGGDGGRPSVYNGEVVRRSCMEALWVELGVCSR